MISMYTKQIEFEVSHRAYPQPRPKARRLPMGVHIYTPNSGKVKAWKDAVQESFSSAAGPDFVPIAGLVRLSADFILNRPVSMCGKKFSEEIIPHVSKPDIDNLLKSTLDALSGYAWNDDSQVWFGECRKFFSAIELGGKSGRKRIPRCAITKINIEY